MADQPSTTEFTVRPLCADDRTWVRRLPTAHWGSLWIVTRGQLHRADALPGFAAVPPLESPGDHSAIVPFISKR